MVVVNLSPWRMGNSTGVSLDGCWDLIISWRKSSWTKQVEPQRRGVCVFRRDLRTVLDGDELVLSLSVFAISCL